jgi:hypothetical protein
MREPWASISQGASEVAAWQHMCSLTQLLLLAASPQHMFSGRRCAAVCCAPPEQVLTRVRCAELAALDCAISLEGARAAAAAAHQLERAGAAAQSRQQRQRALVGAAAAAAASARRAHELAAAQVGLGWALWEGVLWAGLGSWDQADRQASASRGSRRMPGFRPA